MVISAQGTPIFCVRLREMMPHLGNVMSLLREIHCQRKIRKGLKGSRLLGPRVHNPWEVSQTSSYSKAWNRNRRKQVGRNTVTSEGYETRENGGVQASTLAYGDVFLNLEAIQIGWMVFPSVLLTSL